MMKNQCMYEGILNEDSLQRVPLFIQKQLLSYRGTERQQAEWTLHTLEATFSDFEQPIIPVDDWCSILPKGSSYWLELNPSRIIPYPVASSSSVSSEWSHVDMWLIRWDTSNNDTVDVLNVTAITFIQENV